MSAKEGLAIIIGKLKAQDKSNPYGQHSKLGSLLNASQEERTKMDNELESNLTPEDAQMEAAQDCMNAIEAKDAGAFLEAFKDLMTLCQECEDESHDQDIDSHDDHSSMFDEES